jgi:hypothetical protein
MGSIIWTIRFMGNGSTEGVYSQISGKEEMNWKSFSSGAHTLHLTSTKENKLHSTNDEF